MIGNLWLLCCPLCRPAPTPCVRRPGIGRCSPPQSERSWLNVLFLNWPEKPLQNVAFARHKATLPPSLYLLPPPSLQIERWLSFAPLSLWRMSSWEDGNRRDSWTQSRAAISLDAMSCYTRTRLFLFPGSYSRFLASWSFHELIRSLGKKTLIAERNRQ